MRRRWRLFSVLVLVVGSLALVPSVRCRVYGWLRAEPFYDGMPVSWWEREVEASYQPERAWSVIIISPDGKTEVREVQALRWRRVRPLTLADQVVAWLNVGAAPTS